MKPPEAVKPTGFLPLAREHRAGNKNIAQIGWHNTLDRWMCLRKMDRAWCAACYRPTTPRTVLLAVTTGAKHLHL